MTIKDMNWWEKFAWTAIGWHYGCKMNLSIVLRVVLYPFGLLCIPFGALFLPHFMCAPLGMPVPKFFQSVSDITTEGNK